MLTNDNAVVWPVVAACSALERSAAAQRRWRRQPLERGRGGRRWEGGARGMYLCVCEVRIALYVCALERVHSWCTYSS